MEPVQFNILRTLVHRAIEVGIMEASKDPFLVFQYFRKEEIDEWVLSSRVSTAEEIRKEARKRVKNL